MLKNMRIGAKLIVIGTILIAVPLMTVAYLAVTRASAGFTTMTGESLTGSSTALAARIDTIYGHETRAALALANNPVVRAAIAARAQKGDEAAAAEIRVADAQLEPYRTTTEVGDAYETVILVGEDGIVVAGSDPKAVGVDITKRQYFVTAMQGKANVGEVVLSKITGKPVTPVAVPVSVDGTVVGVVVLVLKIDWLLDLVANEKVGKAGYVAVVDSTGLVVAHPSADAILKLNITQTPGMELLGKSMTEGKTGVVDYVFKGDAKTAGFAPVKSTGWSIAHTIPRSEYLAAAVEIRNTILLFSVVSILAAFVVYILFSRGITRPLAKGVQFAEQVASGDFTHQLAINQKDEVGKLAAALNGMTVKLRDVVATIQESAEQVSSSSEEITANAQRLAEGAQSQASTLEETSASVEELTASVDQVAEHAQSQAAAVEQGSSSMEQVHQSIEQVSKNLAEIAGLAGKSVENALEGARAVTEVVDGINLIAGSSERIGGIVSVISDIADQTNLLALNASIEAARAGEHGRGFAVVADEVSKLADRSSTSTKEIEGLIKESVRNVTKGVETARGSQKAMEQIREASQKVKEMIAGLSDSMTQQVSAVKELTKALQNVSEMSQSISAATEEQTTNAKQVSVAVENVNDVTQSAASSAEEMSASTAQLSGMAQQLQKMMSQFKIDGATGSGTTSLGSAGAPAESQSAAKQLAKAG